MISIIVPVYNVENYLARCIESIRNQTYKDYELLLIDDGSTDNSGVICDQYAKTDNRIRVFHKKNGGLSDARNYGLDRIIGEYVTFIDSDDYVGADYLRYLYTMITERKADISIVSMMSITSTDNSFCSSTHHCVEYIGDVALAAMMREKEFNESACAKLYKRELFNNIRYPKGKLFEDLLTVPFLIKDDTICVYSTKILYYYYQREDSIMHTVDKRNMRMWMYGMDRLLEYTYKKKSKAYKYVERRLVKAIFWRIIDWKLFCEDYISIARYIKQKYYSQFRKVLLLPELTLKERLKTMAFLINVRIYRLIRIEFIKYIYNSDNRCFLK
jgi:glycosyltransferase involved in cell wall biosynthesis